MEFKILGPLEAEHEGGSWSSAGLRTRTAVNWLLNSSESAIRLMTRRDVLSERVDEDTSQVSERREGDCAAGGPA